MGWEIRRARAGGYVLGFEGGDPLTDGVLGQTGDAMDIELLHDVLAVGLDGFDTHVQTRRDLLRAMTLGDELKDLALPSGKVGPG